MEVCFTPRASKSVPDCVISSHQDIYEILYSSSGMVAVFRSEHELAQLTNGATASRIDWTKCELAMIGIRWRPFETAVFLLPPELVAWILQMDFGVAAGSQ